ncbi:MAG: radical SAM protein [Chloroflexi bacterium]|nr:radical SAM protein [Chloroflexota bacterium]
MPVEDFEAELAAQPRPDAVLVTSMMTYWYPGPFEVIRRVKARWPDVPVALGGVYATLCCEHARAYSGADVVLSGPGEVQALQWVNEVTRESRTLAIAPTDVLPAHDLRRPQGYVAIQTARGCPFHCPYCAVHQIVPGGMTRRPVEQIVREIVWCVESLGAQDIAFYDDALLVDAERHIHPILDAVIERGLQVRFHTPNGLHARYIDRPLAEKMRRAGFVTIRLGLETIDPEEEKRDGGKVDEVSFVRAVEALKAAGFTAHEVAAYVLIGRPRQDLDKVRATVAFAHSLGIRVHAAEFSPVPGTSEWQNAVNVGCIPADADPLLHNNSIYPCADARAMEKLKQEIRMGNQAL